MRHFGTGSVLGVGLVPVLLVSLGVYAHLLELRDRADPAGDRALVLERATLGGPLLDVDRGTLLGAARQAGASTELVEAVSRMPRSGPLLRSVANRAGFGHIPNDRIEELFASAPSQESAWRGFFETHDGASGLLHYSPVVTTDDGDEAGVVETFRCGVDCGQSRFLLLEQGPAGWTVMAEVPLWIP